MSAALVLCRLPGNGSGDRGSPAPVTYASALPRQAANEPLARKVSRTEPMLVSLTEAARRLGVDRTDTLPRLILNGSIRTVWVGKRQKISQVELHRFCEAGEAARPERAPARRQLRPTVSPAELRARILAIPLDD